MSLQQRILWIALVSLTTTAGIGMADDAFDDAKDGTLPTGWSAAKTGTGDGSVEDSGGRHGTVRQKCADANLVRWTRRAVQSVCRRQTATLRR